MRRMVLGDETHLARRLPARFDHEMRGDRALELGERFAEHDAGPVIADKPDEDTARSERGDVAGHVTGAADLDHAVLDRKNRGRRFGRDAGDLAIDEVVEHDVADAEHGLPGHELERLFEIEHARRRQASFRGAAHR